jgi:RNAse (barnase) inhibitor barstar
MQNIVVQIDTQLIKDWESFHDVFSETFGFFKFYGRSMDAWIDCMSSLDAPETGMSNVHAPLGRVVVVQLENVKDFSVRCPEQYAAIVECSAFVNYRRILTDQEPVLALSFYF